MFAQRSTVVPLTILGAAITLTIAIVATVVGALAFSQAQPTLRLLAGLGEGIVSANQFVGDPAFPGANQVRIAAGTTVTWALGSDEPHTVTFLAGRPRPPFVIPQPEGGDRLPMLNPELMAPTLPSGPWDGTSFVHFELQGPGQEFSLTFARAGTYQYICIFHPDMLAAVEVVAPGSPGITSQAVVDQYAATHLTAVHGPEVAEMMVTRNRAERSESRDGASIWAVRAGTNWRWGHLDLLAFLPDDLTIRQGETVLWYVDHALPHTVTFQPVDGPPLEFVSVQLADGTMVRAPGLGEAPSPELLALLMDPAASPRIVFTGAAAARPSPTHDGRSGYNSGFIGEWVGTPLPMDKTWALTFTTPGTFAYTCVIHEPMGMKGTITVLPAE
jgi:plastocyanin